MRKGILIIIMGLLLSGDTKEIYLSLDSEIRREIDTQMVSISKQIQAELEKLQAEVTAYVESNAGLSQKQILKNLTQLQKDGGGMFDNLTRGMTGAITDKTFTISEDVFFAGIDDETTFDFNKGREMWQAMFVNTCPSCLALHGQIRTHKQWVDSGGVPNQRATLCRIYSKCHCFLVPAEVVPSTAEMREPIKIQATRLRKAEKKRGKKYSKSYQTAILGKINNPKSPIANLNKIKKVV